MTAGFESCSNVLVSSNVGFYRVYMGFMEVTVTGKHL